MSKREQELSLRMMNFPQAIRPREFGRLLSRHASQAREAIRTYFINHIGEIVPVSEVAIAAETTNVRRLVWELTFQDGLRVISERGNDPAVGISLGRSEYCLFDDTPDYSMAHRWFLGRRLRHEDHLDATQSILHYFQTFATWALTTEELATVAGVRSFGERIRYLQAERGFPIATKFTGRPDMNPGEYLLETVERIAEFHDRRVSFELQKRVYERDENACGICGWNRRSWSRDDPRFLELHNRVRGGDPRPGTAENLKVLCTRCHDDVHAGRTRI